MRTIGLVVSLPFLLLSWPKLELLNSFDHVLFGLEAVEGW